MMKYFVIFVLLGASSVFADLTYYSDDDFLTIASDDEFEAFYGDLSQSEIIDSQKYSNDVYRMFILELEDFGFCNLRMIDHTLDLNETYYGVNLNGTIRYFNGFLAHLNHTTISEFHSHISNASISTVRFDVGLRVFNFAYDVLGEFADRTVKDTGYFQMTNAVYRFVITKNLLTNEISSTISFSSSQAASVQRLRFLSKNVYISAISRAFRITDVSQSFINGWIEILSPILRGIVTEKIQFPDIDYYTG